MKHFFLNYRYKLLFFSILSLGIFLRSFEFFMGKSLWEDEAHLALNFIYFGYKDLAKPLANYQSAPIFFLYSVETCSRIFGFGEKALRLFPFICSLFAMPLFYFILKKVDKNRLTALIGFLIFSSNASLIYYSVELKPYTLDVCTYLIITYLVLTDWFWVAKNRNVLLAAAGSIAILYANATTVILFCTTCFFVLEWLKNKKVNLDQVKVMAVWSIIFLLNFFSFIYHHPYAEGMKQIWARSFCPPNIFSEEFKTFFKDKIIDETFFSDMLRITDRYKFSYVFLLIFIIGLLNIITSKKYYVILFTILPFLLHIVLSSLKLYPFYYRFYLYTLPGLIIIISIGTARIYFFLSEKLNKIIGYCFCSISLFCYLLPSYQKFPFWDLEIKPSLAYINNKYPDKKIFITTPTTLYQYYYATNYAKNSNFTAIAWNLSSSQYYAAISGESSNYILLRSGTDVDGFHDVVKDLKQKQLIVNEFEYKTYVVDEIKPSSDSISQSN